jgi:hypothetical protein
MKRLRVLPGKLFASIRSLRGHERPRANGGEEARGKGQSLLRLHEYQHRVIVEIFKISIAGFFAFAAILLAFGMISLLDPGAPPWMALVIGALGAVLLYALYRTMQEFKSYRRNYEEITARLRARLMNRARPTVPAGQGGHPTGVVTHHLLSALKPKEHAGWDHKSCRNCHKTIELLATVCHHCGQEQETLLVN